MLTRPLARGKRYNKWVIYIARSIMPPTSAAASPSITAVVLAGGRSSRMGNDKALLTWRGRPFIEHIVDALQTQVDRIVINSNSPADFAHLGLPLLPDTLIERCGPLAGIATALCANSTALTLVVPCDNPLLSPQLVERLLAALDHEQTDLAYACCNGDNLYLYALMRHDLRDNLVTFLRGTDYAVRHWYATLRTSRVDFSDQPEYFRNINSIDDLARLPPR